MKPLTQLAHEAVAKVLKPGDIAIDLTAGNGHDTLFLASCVGLTGHVYAFDIQASAIEATKKLLDQHSLESCASLYHETHAKWFAFVPLEHKNQIKVAMMNLGYLPGGDKLIVTQQASTRAAIRAVLECLQPGGVLSILAYTGHPGGQSEADAVHDIVRDLDTARFEIICEPVLQVVQAPVLHLVSNRASYSGAPIGLSKSVPDGLIQFP